MLITSMMLAVIVNSFDFSVRAVRNGIVSPSGHGREARGFPRRTADRGSSEGARATPGVCKSKYRGEPRLAEGRSGSCSTWHLRSGNECLLGLGIVTYACRNERHPSRKLDHARNQLANGVIGIVAA